MNEPQSVADPSEADSEGAALRAYILEDDPEVAEVEADLLRDLGYTVVSCRRIVELGDLMQLGLPHLLVIDATLPDGDGAEVTALLLDAWPGIPVVIVSAAAPERLRELRSIGPVLAKPFSIDHFRAAVMAAVEMPRGQPAERLSSRAER